MSLEDESKREFLKILNQLSQDRGQPLDKVFTAWIAENLFGIDNEEAIDRCIDVGKKNDFGIDFFHKNDDPATEPYIVWGQAKFSEKFDYIISTGVIHHLIEPETALKYFYKNQAVGL